MADVTYLSQIPLFEELRGEHIIVRPYREVDAVDHYAAIDESREHCRPWLPWPDYYHSIEDSRDYIARCRARWIVREDLSVGIFDVENGRFLGGSGLHPRNWDARIFEIGYWLRSSAEGHGYMSETVKLLTDYAFADLHANRVYIRCDARNTRSAAVAQRLGFVREALLRNDALANDGTVRDTLVFSLTPDDPRWPS
ncbi:MAG: Acetyltransferase, GNAT family [Ktedonobacterales bacterium]|jgi:RimJ/RimL family protein N-acetyltransferase|nr:MAG: Acetyltransferase, GNAT family [Ktedonobacterales bacterium]